MGKTPPSTRRQDLELARAVAEGCCESWHTFVHRYTPIMVSVLNRYFDSEDELKTVYTDILEQLYKRKLATYEGRAALSTWARVRDAEHGHGDHVRKRNGRPEIPVCVQQLDEVDQTVYRHFFEREHTLEETWRHLGQDQNPAPTLDQVVDSIARIHEAFGPRRQTASPAPPEGRVRGSERGSPFWSSWMSEPGDPVSTETGLPGGRSDRQGGTNQGRTRACPHPPPP